MLNLAGGCFTPCVRRIPSTWIMDGLGVWGWEEMAARGMPCAAGRIGGPARAYSSYKIARDAQILVLAVFECIDHQVYNQDMTLNIFAPYLPDVVLRYHQKKLNFTDL